uniref:Uncharacterized protein n=1 Tax=Meloidogyne hapla TaxID=6305 RepID=A0A1I8BP87_MELHA
MLCDPHVFAHCWIFFENVPDEKISYEESHGELLQNHHRIVVLARIEEEPKKQIPIPFENQYRTSLPRNVLDSGQSQARMVSNVLP